MVIASDEVEKLQMENAELRKVLFAVCGSTDVGIGISRLATVENMISQYTTSYNGFFNSLIKALKKYQEFIRGLQ